jgi:hypothetical protein
MAKDKANKIAMKMESNFSVSTADYSFSSNDETSNGNPLVEKDQLYMSRLQTSDTKMWHQLPNSYSMCLKTLQFSRKVDQLFSSEH